MQSVCIHFQLNQPRRLRTYRFFDINKKHDYFDDYQNRYLTNRLAERSYLPANKMLMELIQKYDKEMAVSFSISGTSLRFFEKYRPEVLDSFKALSETGQVEICGNTFSNSLASLSNKTAFIDQIKIQQQLLERLLGEHPVTFCNTGYIYSDEIGEWIAETGYQVVLSEGARHILGWKNPGYLYCNPYQTDLKLLLRNYALCDDITFRFTDTSWDQYPLTADKFLNFLKRVPEEIPMINIYFDYETIGESYTADTGIFDFFKALFTLLAESPDYQLINPKTMINSTLPVSTMHAPWAISISGEEKDTGEWLGNNLQQEAFQQLYRLEELYDKSDNQEAKESWLLLQAADHFNYMGTHWIPKPAVRHNFDVYPSPYQAFINYMNVLNDVELQLM